MAPQHAEASADSGSRGRGGVSCEACEATGEPHSGPPSKASVLDSAELLEGEDGSPAEADGPTGADGLIPRSGAAGGSVPSGLPP